MNGPFARVIDVIDDDVRIIPHIIVRILNFGLGDTFYPRPLQRRTHRLRKVTCK